MLYDVDLFVRGLSRGIHPSVANLLLRAKAWVTGRGWHLTQRERK